MNSLQKIDTQKVARELRKGYMHLLTNQAKKVARSVDSHFFVEGDEEGEEVRPYFYGSISFGITVLLFILVQVH